MNTGIASAKYLLSFNKCLNYTCTTRIPYLCSYSFGNRMEGRELPLIMISRLPAVDIPSSANAASSKDKAAPQLLQPSVVDLKKLTQETLLLPNSFLHWMNAVRNRALPPHACKSNRHVVSKIGFSTSKAKLCFIYQAVEICKI